MPALHRYVLQLEHLISVRQQLLKGGEQGPELGAEPEAELEAEPGAEVLAEPGDMVVVVAAVQAQE